MFMQCPYLTKKAPEGARGRDAEPERSFRRGYTLNGEENPVRGFAAAIVVQVLVGVSLFTLPLVLGYGETRISVLNMALGSFVVVLAIGLFEHQYFAGCEHNRALRARRRLRPPRSLSIGPPTLLCPIPSDLWHASF